MPTSPRKTAAVALAVVGVAGLSLASAAQLSVTSSNLAAGTTLVAACDDDGVSVGFGTEFQTDRYTATAVTVDGIDAACADQEIRLTLRDGDAVLEEVTGTVPADGGSFTAPLTTPRDAEVIDGAAVLIHG